MVIYSIQKQQLTKAFVTKHSKCTDLYRGWELRLIVSLINTCICGQSGSSVITAVYLSLLVLRYLAVSLENDFRCSVQASYGIDVPEVLHQRLCTSLSTCFALVFSFCMKTILIQTRKRLLTHFFSDSVEQFQCQASEGNSRP